MTRRRQGVGWLVGGRQAASVAALGRTQPEALPVITQLERGRLAAMEHLAARLH